MTLADLIEFSYDAWLSYRGLVFSNDEISLYAAFTFGSLRYGPPSAKQRGWVPAILGVA